MNDEEFEALLLENREKVYRLALRLTGNREEALDVVQETMFAAYRNRSRFRGEARFSTYLYRIGVNFSFAALKKHKGRHNVPIEDVRGLASPEPSPAREFRRAELAGRLKQLVDRLPPRQKAALHLRLYEDLSFNEVAAALGCRPATARTLYFFGLQGLRRLADGELDALQQEEAGEVAPAVVTAAGRGREEDDGSE